MEYNVTENKAELSALTYTPVVLWVDIFLFQGALAPGGIRAEIAVFVRSIFLLGGVELLAQKTKKEKTCSMRKSISRRSA